MTTTRHRIAGSYYVDGYLSAEHPAWCPVVAVDGALYHTLDLDDLEPAMDMPFTADAEGLTYPALSSSVAFRPAEGEIDRALAMHRAKAAA